MIGYLNGTIELLDQPFIIIDVNGVGYRVLVSENVFLNLAKGQNLKIFTHTHVKEDALELFGFLEAKDLRLFENLLTVSGVGPKTALNIFSFGKREEIINAIINSDVAFFTSVPRLGTKNAQKIIIELKSKMGSSHELDLSGKEINENKEMVQALKNFGFTTGEAQDALKNIKDPNLSPEEKIRLALKTLGKR